MIALAAGLADATDVTNVIGTILDKGVVGAFALIFIWLYLKKDKELADERTARINDSKEGLKLALSLQEKTQITIEKLGEMFSESKRLIDRLLEKIREGGRS